MSGREIKEIEEELEGYKWKRQKKRNARGGERKSDRWTHTHKHTQMRTHTHRGVDARKALCSMNAGKTLTTSIKRVINI